MTKVNKVFSIILLVAGVVSIVAEIVCIVLGNLSAMFVADSIAIATVLLIVAVYGCINHKVDTVVNEEDNVVDVIHYKEV